MTLREWFRLARKERNATNPDDRTLHYLNSFIEYRQGNKKHKSIWEDFDSFISTRSFTTADTALVEFFKQGISKGQPAPLAGPNVSVSDRVISTVINLRNARNLVSHSYYQDNLEPNFKALERIADTPPSSEKNIKDHPKDWDNWLNTLKNEASEMTTTVNAARLRISAKATTVPPKKAPPQAMRTPVWFTWRSSAKKIFKPGALDKKSMRVKSYLMSKRRYVSGLFDERDVKYLEDLMSIDANAYRFVVELQVRLSPAAQRRAVQPTIFSGGYNNLFTSAQHDQISGGLTCRLEKNSCRHKNLRCDCATKGVPELLVSRADTSDAVMIEIRHPMFLLTEHLKNYSIPDIDLIHLRRNVP